MSQNDKAVIKDVLDNLEYARKRADMIGQEMQVAIRHIQNLQLKLNDVAQHIEAQEQGLHALIQ